MTQPDPRVLRACGHRTAGMGEIVLKAAGPLLRPHVAPTAAQIEHERSMWGPHPDALHAWVEEGIYQAGLRFLREFTGAILGRKNPTISKADTPKPPGWGEVMKLFESQAPPEEQMATWSSLVETFAKTLLPGHTVAEKAAVWALQSNLLHVIGERVKAVTTPGAWDLYAHTLPPAGKEVLHWTKIRGAQFITNMKDSAKKEVLAALVENRLAGGNHHEFSKTLLERMGKLNRDWRRIAITETAMAVSSGQLATVADSGEWEAIWVAGPQACPFCKKMNHRTFQIVRADHPKLDGDKQVWPGKHNVGRSPSLHRKDGTTRTKDELWYPCQPAHPNCACVWAIRRRLVSSVAKKAAAQLAASRGF